MSTHSIIRVGISTLLFISGFFIHFQAKAQTKQETIDWLNSKFPKNPVVYGDVFRSAQKMKIYPDGTFEITILDFEVPFNYINAKVQSTTTIRGNFKDFSPNSVSTRVTNGLLFINLDCYGNKDCVRILSQSGEKVGTLEMDGALFGAFYTYENNLAERMKKAFVHLITLCGGRKEAF